jgi:hypothetical protein
MFLKLTTKEIKMCIELKIKAKHLALEPSIIKREENKLKGQIKYTKGTDSSLIWKLNSLTNHRKWNVRNEARATELARAYLAGKPYSYVEKKRNNDGMFQLYIVPRIVAMVAKYGTREQRSVDRKVIAEWSKQ